MNYALQQKMQGPCRQKPWHGCIGSGPVGHGHLQWWFLEYSKPVVLVLGLLIAPTQQGTNIGYDLDELGLSFHKLAQPLGKEWLSKQLYPILASMVRDSRLKNANALLEFWDADLHSIYQLDHGLKACRSIAVMDDQPTGEGDACL